MLSGYLDNVAKLSFHKHKDVCFSFAPFHIFLITNEDISEKLGSCINFQRLIKVMYLILWEQYNYSFHPKRESVHGPLNSLSDLVFNKTIEKRNLSFFGAKYRLCFV